MLFRHISSSEANFYNLRTNVYVPIPLSDFLVKKKIFPDSLDPFVTIAKIGKNQWPPINRALYLRFPTWAEGRD